MKLDEHERTLKQLAHLDALAGHGDFNTVNGGSITRDHMYSPAGVLIPQNVARQLAEPAYREWWARVMPPPSDEDYEAPGVYL